MSGIGIDDLISDLHGMADQLDIDMTGAVITEASSIQSDLGMDSLNLMDFLIFLERKYQVKIGDDQLGSVETLGDMLDVLNNVVAAS